MASLTICVFLLLLLSTSQSLSNYHLKGKHLRVGLPMSLPSNATEAEIGNKTVNPNDTNVAFVKWASQRNNFTFQFVALNKAEPSRDLVRHFRSNLVRVNFVTLVVPEISPRTPYKNADMLTPHNSDRLRALIQTPRRESNVWSFVLPYTAMVWLCFFASMGVLIILLKNFTSVALTCGGRLENFQTWASSLSYVFGVATNQGGSCSSQTYSVRFVAALWCLVALVMVNAYSGSLITYMTLPKITPVLKSVEDLPSRPDLNIVSHTSSYAGGVIKNSTLYKPVIGNFLKFPSNFCGLLYSEVSKCLSLVKKGGYVFVCMGTEAVVWLKNDYANTKTCDMMRTEEGTETFYAAYLIPLNSPHEFRNTLDVTILEATSYGLFQKWQSEFMTKGAYCRSYRVMEQNIRKLTLVDYSSASVILAIGITLSTVAFIAERFVLKKTSAS